MTKRKPSGEVYDFAAHHREKSVADISARINLDWDAAADPESAAWDGAVRQYAGEIYETRMAERQAVKSGAAK